MATTFSLNMFAIYDGDFFINEVINGKANYILANIHS